MMTTQEKRKDIIRRGLEGLDVTQIENYVVQKYMLHLADGKKINGAEQYIQFVKSLLAAMPDIKYNVKDIVADGDIVAVRTSFTGTNTGSLSGMPPTGKKVAMDEAFFFRWEGDKIVEEWSFLNYMDLMQQLGLALVPGEARG